MASQLCYKGIYTTIHRYIYFVKKMVVRTVGTLLQHSESILIPIEISWCHTCSEKQLRFPH